MSFLKTRIDPQVRNKHQSKSSSKGTNHQSDENMNLIDQQHKKCLNSSKLGKHSSIPTHRNELYRRYTDQISIKKVN